MARKTATPDVANGSLVRIAVRLTGLTPLFMDALCIEEQERIRLKKRAPKIEERRTPREEAEDRLHVLADGRPHVTPYVWPTLVNAGRFVRYDGKRQISTAQESVLGGLMAIEDAVVPLLPANGSPLTWEPELRGARGDNGAVVKILPRFDSWAAEYTIRINGQFVNPLKIRELHDMAGQFIGMGPMRPNRKGFFGKFTVDKWEEIGT